jgi:hypothetical protein
MALSSLDSLRRSALESDEVESSLKLFKCHIYVKQTLSIGRSLDMTALHPNVSLSRCKVDRDWQG